MAGLVGAAELFPLLLDPARRGRAALLVLLLSFVAPVVLEPVFNRFGRSRTTGAARRPSCRRGRARPRGARRGCEQADDEAERLRLRSRLDPARRPLRHPRRDGDDARGADGRRARARPPALPARRVGTALAMAAAAGFVLVLWALLNGHVRRGDRRRRRRRRPRRAVRPPRRLAARAPARAAAGGAVAELGVRLRPLRRRADGRPPRVRVGVRAALGGEPAGSAPPRLVYLWLFSHPTVPERVEAARRAAASSTVPA